MSAFSRLWRRAPLWRWSLYGSVGFLGLAALYPTPFMLRHAPWLAHVPGTTAPASPSSGGSPPSSDAQQSGAAQQPGNSPDRVAAPSMNASFVGSVPFNGHTLPLPAGTWHPVLTGQVGPGGVQLFNILARTDRGVVTGVIIARTTTRPLPADATAGLDDTCHDDRNFAARVMSDGQNGVRECWSVAESTGSANELITTAFQRLHTFGFPVSPLYVTAVWLRATTTKDGSTDVNAVDTLLAPVRPGSTELIAPLAVWTKTELPNAPLAQNFVRGTTKWMTNWVGVLREGMTHGLSSGTVPDELARDPAAP